MIDKQKIVAIILILFAYLLYIVLNKPVVYTPIVSTNNGQLRGVADTSRDGRIYYKYLGIPYAKPPVDELRYESPQPPEKWDSVKTMDNFGNECAQVQFVIGFIAGDEDCLFLNVFTPKITKDGELLPVMFYIHGGLFISESSNNVGPDYFMDQDIVLVTINYRLASLGFLNTGDGVVRGNMGLKDQTFALKWVQENIKQFGGDSNKVTIFGESAGGACVHYHLLSPMSKGLFHKAISQSGTALGSWALQTQPKAQAQRYAEQLNCSNKNAQELVLCLKKVPIQRILEVHLETANLFTEVISIFVPTLETIYNDSDTFISQHPYTIMKAGNMQRIPWINGFTSHEGLFFSARIMTNESLLSTFHNHFPQYLNNMLFFDTYTSPEFMKKVRDFYFGPNTKINSMSQIDNFTNLATDLVFGIGAQTSIELQSKYSPVYPYFYSYKGEFSVTTLILALKRRFTGIIEILSHVLTSIIEKKIWGTNNFPNYGSCHADELILLFKASAYNEITKGDKDYKFSKQLIKLWADFAKDEKPMEIQGIRWNPWSGKNKKYLHLDNEVSQISAPFDYRLNFWKKMKLYP